MASRSAKHHHKAMGGVPGEDSKTENYNGAENNVEKEAEEKKHGGKVHKRKAGGAMHHMEGHDAKRRMDRPGRKRGGSVGADMHPLSSAAAEHGGREEDADDGSSKGDVP